MAQDPAESPYRAVKRMPNRCNQLDIHSILTKEIYSQTFDDAVSNKLTPSGIGTVLSGGGGGVNTAGSASYGFEDTEIYFDSTASDGSSSRINGELLWSISELNNNNDVQNIVELKVGSFFFPRVQGPAGQPDIFFFRRLYMRVLNAPASQSVSVQNSNYYHFEFQVDDLNSVAVRLTPVKESYYFNRPVTSFTSLQVRFLLPYTFSPIHIPDDTLTVESVFPGMVPPAQFRITDGLTTAEIGPIGVLPAPGVAIYFTNYQSNSPAINDAVNSEYGWFVVNIIDNINFTVSGIDTSAAAGSYSATMIIAKNRIAFPMRFTSVKNQITNFITATHE